MHPAGELVEVVEAGRDADDLALVLVEVVDLVEVVAEGVADRRKVLRDAPLGNGEEGLLGLVERGVDVARVVVADRGDLAGGLDQPAHYPAALDDVGVVLDVDGRWDGVDEGGQ